MGWRGQGRGAGQSGATGLGNKGGDRVRRGGLCGQAPSVSPAGRQLPSALRQEGQVAFAPPNDGGDVAGSVQAAFSLAGRLGHRCNPTVAKGMVFTLRESECV